MGSFGKGIGIILLGLIMRGLGTVLAAMEPKFNWHERFFLACAWIPKATVQAAIGGTILNKANQFPDYIPVKKQWVSWGKDLLSMAVVAVIITAPLGAILTNTLGVIWLNDDSEFDKSSPGIDQGHAPPGKSLFKQNTDEEHPFGEPMESPAGKDDGFGQTPATGAGKAKDFIEESGDLDDIEETPAKKFGQTKDLGLASSNISKVREAQKNSHVKKVNGN